MQARLLAIPSNRVPRWTLAVLRDLGAKADLPSIESVCKAAAFRTVMTVPGLEQCRRLLCEVVGSEASLFVDPFPERSQASPMRHL